jgi:hypothetical protein
MNVSQIVRESVFCQSWVHVGIDHRRKYVRVLHIHSSLAVKANAFWQ